MIASPRTRVGLGIALGALCLPVVAGPMTFSEFPSIQVVSSGGSQLSSELYRVLVATDGGLYADYVAPASHCSSLKVHFRIDGQERAVSDVIAPGAHSGYRELGPVAPGTHELALQAEGVPGGCNHGVLQSWAGTLKVLTSPVTSDEPQLAGMLGPVVFEERSVNFAWGYVDQGCYMTADGSVFQFQYARTDRPWRPDSASDGTLAPADMLEHYSHDNKQTGRIPRAEVAERIAVLRAARQERMPAQHTAYDAGEHTLSGWLLDPNSGRYERVLLLQSGDFARTNTSPQAKTLIDWMKRSFAAGSCNR